MENIDWDAASRRRTNRIRAYVRAKQIDIVDSVPLGTVSQHMRSDANGMPIPTLAEFETARGGEQIREGVESCYDSAGVFLGLGEHQTDLVVLAKTKTRPVIVRRSRTRARGAPAMLPNVCAKVKSTELSLRCKHQVSCVRSFDFGH